MVCPTVPGNPRFDLVLLSGAHSHASPVCCIEQPLLCAIERVYFREAVGTKAGFAARRWSVAQESSEEEAAPGNPCPFLHDGRIALCVHHIMGICSSSKLNSCGRGIQL
jgi:hypothetical protein